MAGPDSLPLQIWRSSVQFSPGRSLLPLALTVLLSGEEDELIGLTASWGGIMLRHLEPEVSVGCDSR